MLPFSATPRISLSFTRPHRRTSSVGAPSFAIVIVAGLISRLFIGFFVNPVLYEMVARDGDVLQV